MKVSRKDKKLKLFQNEEAIVKSRDISALLDYGKHRNCVTTITNDSTRCRDDLC